MATKLFVGSLAYSVTDDQLQDAFASVGTVASAKVIMDRETQRSRGFGFVEMENEADADAAIKQLNETEIAGRRIIVSEAKPQKAR